MADYTDTYTNTYNPNLYGTNAYNRSLSAQLAATQLARQQTGASYADLYAQAQGQNLQTGALSGAGGLTGGMRDAYLAKQNAASMGALSNIYAQRDQAMGQIAQQEMAASSNALMEAQQYTAYEQAKQQAELARISQVDQVLTQAGGYENLTDAQKQSLAVLGVSDSELQTRATIVADEQKLARSESFGSAVRLAGGATAGVKAIGKVNNEIAVRAIAKELGEDIKDKAVREVAQGLADDAVKIAAKEVGEEAAKDSAKWFTKILKGKTTAIAEKYGVKVGTTAAKGLMSGISKVLGVWGVVTTIDMALEIFGVDEGLDGILLSGMSETNRDEWVKRLNWVGL